MSFEKNFKIPPERMSPAPFWFLNDDLDGCAIIEQLKTLKKQHIHMVVLHPRNGLEVEYLSAAFWQKMEFIIKKCDELSMKVILYDEYNWPSGTMGGMLLRERPEYCQRFLDYAILKGKRCRYRIDGIPLAAFAINQTTHEVIDITCSIRGNVLEWQRPARGFEAIVFYIKIFEMLLSPSLGTPHSRGERGYIDLMNPDAVRYFIKNTHEEYRKRFARYFDSTIIGIFTDEPANNDGMMWTDQFPAAFKKRFDFEIIPHLYELVYDIGNEYPRTRSAYYNCVVELYVESYYRQVGDWCRAHGIFFTGHLLHEDSLHNLGGDHGSLYFPLKEMDIPGIDYLDDRPGYDCSRSFICQSGTTLAPKILSSIAHHLGRTRNICETGGGAGWGSTPEKIKRTTAWLAACGVDWISPHATFLSIKGFRKRDWPPSYSNHQPWWRHYSLLADMNARLSLFNSSGTHIAHYAILFPMSALTLNYTLYNQKDELRETINSLSALSEAMLRIQCDYDFIFEEEFIEGSVAVDGTDFVVGDERYRVLIIPSISYISITVYQCIAEFYHRGGTVIFFWQLPVHSEKQAHDPAIATITRALFGDASTDRERSEINTAGGRAFLLMNRCQSVESCEERLLDLCKIKNLPADITITPRNRDFIYQHRKIDADDYYLLLNLGGEDQIVAIQFSACGFIALLGPEDGEIYRITQNETNGVSGLRFRRGEPFVICISREMKPGQLPLPMMAHPAALPLLPLPETWRIKPAGKPLLLLNDWTLTIRSRKPRSPDACAREDATWNSFSLSVKARAYILRALLYIPGKFFKKKNSSHFSLGVAMENFIPVLKNGIGIDPYAFRGAEIASVVDVYTKRIHFMEKPVYPGDEFEMTTSIVIEYIPADGITLVYEDLGEPISLIINGRIIDVDVVRRISNLVYLWDRSNLEIAIDRYLSMGKNTLSIRTKSPDIPGAGGIEPYVLRGNFSVKNKTIRPPVDAIRSVSWHVAGLGNYTGCVTYSNRLVLPAKYRDKRLMLSFADVRDTIDVRINGKNAGVRAWPPYEFDVTEHLMIGENRIEADVCNTAENLFGVAPLASGIIGEANIVAYEKFADG